ncbi:MAG TPA: hypothetical protein VK800_10485 [Steroidobacteraceae bacterium]|nr:hypothetical protein [Steroidobacteraceae bacterium]
MHLAANPGSVPGRRAHVLLAMSVMLENLLKFRESGQVQRRLLIPVAFILFSANLAFQYPGSWMPDSIITYNEAVSGHYSDWQPPIMAWLWSLVRRLVDGTPGMLVLQLGFHWLGFALIADGLMRAGKHRSAWLVLFSGAFPVFLFYNGIVLKDVGMASALVTAFGLAFRYRIVGQPISRPALCVAALLLAYGTLVRINAIFAFGPLLIYMLPGRARLMGIKVLFILTGVLAGLALSLSSFINHDLLGARSSGAIQSLQLFDLNGIAYHTSDPTVLPAQMAFSAADLTQCYTPYWWDTLSPWGTCGFAWRRLGPDDSPARNALGHRWLVQIAAHPVAYLQHRLKVFNSILYFLVPAKHCRYAPGCGFVYAKDGTRSFPPVTQRDIRVDYLKKNFITWPVTWLVVGLMFLWLSTQIPHQETAAAARALLLSGLSYLAFMLPIGVATDIRYAYWTIMAVLLAVLICLDEARKVFSWRDKRCVAGVALLLLTIVAGLLARVANFTALVT